MFFAPMEHATTTLPTQLLQISLIKQSNAQTISMATFTTPLSQ
jgi:hypothetical protein